MLFVFGLLDCVSFFSFLFLYDLGIGSNFSIVFLFFNIYFTVCVSY
jgi:hypothetical protein